MSYQLDETAALPANLVSDEVITIRDSAVDQNGLVFLKYAPFFSKDFILSYTDTSGATRILVKGIDYVFDVKLILRNLPTTLTAWGVVRLVAPELNGTLNVNYRTLGGSMLVNQAAVLDYVQNTRLNPLMSQYVLVPYPIKNTAQGVFPADTFDNIQSLISERGSLHWGVDRKELPVDEMVGQIGSVVVKGTGEVLAGSSGGDSGGSGGTGGGTVIDGIVQIEGGNTIPVSVLGTVSVVGMSAVAKDDSIQRLITAVESQSGTSGGALEAGGNLQALATATGDAQDSSYSGSNKASLISLLKAVWGRLASPLSIRALNYATDSVTTNPSGTQDVRVTSSTLPTGAATESGNLQTIAQETQANNALLESIDQRLSQNLSVNVANQAGTQAVSAAALPLPANAAQESGGNLQTIRSNIGTPADAPYVGSGDSSLISAVKGVVSAIKSTIQIRALSSASDSVTIQGGNSSAVKVDGSQVTQPISAASLPLPTGAASETGNLQSIATNTQTTNAIIGSTADAVYAGTGSSTAIGLLKGVYARLSSALNIRALSSSTDSVRVEALSTLPVSSTQLPTSLGKKSAASSLAVTLASDESSIAITSSGGQLALDTSIQALIQAVGNQVSFESTIWFDSTVTPVVYYVRREVADPITRDVSVTWETMDGQPATPDVSKLSAVSDDKGVVAESVRYMAQTTATGYTSGDQLIHFYGLDVNNVPPTVAYSFWFNASSGATLAQAPAAGHYASSSSQTVSVTSTVLPANAAQESGGNLSAIKATAGDVADAAYAGAGSAGLVGLLKGLYNRLGSTLSIRLLQSATDSVTIVPSGTQKVQADTLPLPADAARETGNIQNLANATGGVSDNPYSGTGNATLVSALKGIHSVLSGQTNFRALHSTTDSITTVPSGTQSVSVSSLPLPAGAATEAGNLKTIADNTEASNNLLFEILGNVSVTQPVQVENFPVTQAVTATSLPLPSGAATETGNLQTIAASIGSPASSAIPPTGGSGSLGWLSGIYQKLLAGLSVTVTQLPSLPAGTNAIGKVEVTNLPGTQAVSATSLPLPTGAAVESGGNLQTISNNTGGINSTTGTTADTAYNGVGNATLVALLKGLYARLGTALNIRNLSSASDSVTTVPSGTQQVSAASLPLPTGAAIESGNLQTIASNSTDLNTAIGTTYDPTYTGANYTSVIGMLKAVYYGIKGVLNIRSLTAATDTVTIVPSGIQTVQSAQLPSALGKQTAAQSLSVTLAGNEPAISVTSAGGSLALDSSVQELITAIKASSALDSTVWFDPSTTPPTYYVRREVLDQENGAIVVSWTDMSGQTATPVLSKLTSVSNAAQISTQAVSYRATASGTGYANGDHLMHVYGLDADTSPPQLAYSFWFNATSGVVLSSAPSNGTYETAASQSVSVSSSVLPTNAAQETGGNLDAIKTRLGDVSDADYSGSGSGSINSILKSIRTKIYATLNIRALSSGTDSVTIQGGNSTAVKVDGSAVTQPISAAALPLPAGAATESGNLATLTQTTGAAADAAYAGTGNTTVVGGLKGLYAKLSTALNIRALTSATDSVTTVPSGTQAVSAASLPLPTGAAQESGNLQTVAQAQGTSATGVVQLSGGAGVLGWLSGIYQKLSNTLTVSVSSLPAIPAGSNAIGSVTVSNLPATQAVSATALPLPTGAATETGNIQTLRTVTGAAADAAYAGSGNATVISGLKGIYAKLGTALSIRNLTAATDVVTVQGGNSTAVKTDGSATTQPVSVASLPLPTGAAAESGGNLQLIADRSLTVDTSIRNTKSISTSVWRDATVQPAVYYVRKETYNTSDGTSQVTWHTPTGATATPTVANLSTVADSSGSSTVSTFHTYETVYTASTAATGYSVGDVLVRGYGLDTSGASPALEYSFWLNATTGAVLSSAPSAGHLQTSGSSTVAVSSSALPTNAAKETGGNLAAIANAAGTAADPVYIGSYVETIETRVAPTVLLPARSTYDYGNGFTATIPSPVGLANGDYWVIVANEDNVTQHPNVSLPSGWTKLQTATTSGDGQSFALWYREFDGVSTSVTLGFDAGDSIATSFGIINTAGPSTQQQLTNNTEGTTVSLSGLTVSAAEANSTILMVLQPDVHGPAGSIAFTFPAGYTDASRDLTSQYCAIGAAQLRDVAAGNYTSAGAQMTCDTVMAGWVGMTVWRPKVTVQQNTVEQDMTIISGMKALYDKVNPEVASRHRNITTTYSASTAGTGYAIGDLITKTITLTLNETNVLEVLETVWVNVTTSTILASPPNAAHIALAGGGGSSGSSTVQVSNFPATQSISAAALPLPANAAIETGNLQTIAQAQGNSGTGINQPTGGTGLLGWLSGIYQKLSNTLTVTVSSLPALPTGSNSIGTVGVSSLPALPAGANAIGSVSVSSLPALPTGANAIGTVGVNNFPATQAVSATALPLPTGAATETGNIQTLRTVTGAVADVAYAGSGDATVVSALKGVYAAINTLSSSLGSGTKKQFIMSIPSAAVAANKIWFDLFNGAAAGTVIKIVSIKAIVDTDTAVTGVLGVELMTTRTTAVGTGGTAATAESATTTVPTIASLDTTNTLTSGITARVTPTGGATAGAVLTRRWVFTEETSVAASWEYELLPEGITALYLRQNQGLRVIQGAVASVGNIAFEVSFEVTP